MAFAEINGFRMHYRVTGQGPPLVLAHGLMGSIAMNEAIAAVERPELLADSFTVINYDARGHGESGYTADPSHYSWFSLAEDMLGLLRHLRLQRAHIGGGSMGAGTALAVALAYPGTVDRLLLIAPPPLPARGGEAPGGGAALVASMFASFAQLIEQVGMAQAVDVVVKQPLFAQLRQQDPEYFDLSVEWMKRQRGPAMVAAIRGLVNGPPLPVKRLGEIKAPTLIIAHPDDPVHPLASAELLKSALPAAELFRVPSQTYYRERAEEVAAVIKEFLGAMSAGRQVEQRA